MKLFYFVGGPKAGQMEEFLRRLSLVGGPPSSWRIYPHTARDGKALHVVEGGSQVDILDHLEQFHDIYERTEIVEIEHRR